MHYFHIDQIYVVVAFLNTTIKKMFERRSLWIKSALKILYEHNQNMSKHRFDRAVKLTIPTYRLHPYTFQLISCK